MLDENLYNLLKTESIIQNMTMNDIIKNSLLNLEPIKYMKMRPKEYKRQVSIYFNEEEIEKVKFRAFYDNVSVQALIYSHITKYLLEKNGMEYL